VSKNKKKPKVEYQPSGTKKPAAEAMPDFNDMRPAWRLANIDLIHPDNWKDDHLADAQMIERIRERLVRFESMKWKEILGHENHPIDVNRLSAHAQKRLEAKQVEASTLVSLRCAYTERIWGIRNENILSLLWWDPNHKVYPLKKK